MLIEYVLRFEAWFFGVTRIYGNLVGVAVMLWTCIQKVCDLNFGQDRKYSGTDVYPCFPYPQQVNLRIVPKPWKTQISQIWSFLHAAQEQTWNEMRMFVLEKTIKSSEEKVVDSVIFCYPSDFVFCIFKCHCCCPLLFTSDLGIWISDMKKCRITYFTLCLKWFPSGLLLTQHLLVWPDSCFICYSNFITDGEWSQTSWQSL
jgi:hypothetical protein